MHEAEKVLDMIIKACFHTAKILQPRSQPPHLPAATVATQGPLVLRGRLRPVRLVGRNQLDAAFSQFLIR